MKRKKIKTIIILIIISVIVSGVVFAMMNKKPKTVYITEPVIRGDIIQSVSETGTVKSANEIDLNFLNPGKIAKINNKIGDKIMEGQILAELDCSDLLIKKNEANANIDVARASHNKLLAGATREDINVAKAGVQQAKIAYEAAEKELARTKESTDENFAQAKKTLADLKSKTSNDITTSEQAVINAEISLENTKITYQRTIDNYKESALTIIDDKLTVANNALDTVNKTVNDDILKDVLSIKNVSYLDSIDRTYIESKALLEAAKSNSAAAKNGANSSYIIKITNDTFDMLNKVLLSLQYTFTALENTVISSSLSQTSLDAFKSGITTQQTLVIAGVNSLQASRQNLEKALLDYTTNTVAAENSLRQAQVAYDSALKTAQNALASAEVTGGQQITAAQSRTDSAFEAWQVAQSRYNQTIAPANRQDILVSEAKIKQAQAALDTINKNIDNCYIKAPISGTITKSNYEAGEQPSAGKPVLSMLGENNFEIEVLISEADIAKVNKDDIAEITLDAFGDELKFAGTVEFIEPAETIIQDVIYYKVTVVFSDLTEGAALNPALANIKSGMTANIIITTAKKENILIIPGRSVIDKNGDGKFTRVLINGIIEERKITLGLRGDGGMMELLSGVKEGEMVVTYVKEE